MSGDSKISDLPDGTATSGTEIVPVVQGGSTVRRLINQLLSPSWGASGVGYLASGIGATATTVEARLKRRFVDANDFISQSNTAAQNVTGWGNLVTYVNSLPNGAHVQASRGTYLFNASIQRPLNCLLAGEGKNTSFFSFSNAGDGIQSTSPINSSTAVHFGLRDICLINTNVANTGAGFDDVGGTFVDLYNVYITNFKYGVIFDQTEIATIDQCLLESTVANHVLLWLVNGADHTPGANTGFTNRITVTRNQFNSSATGLWQIADDGGGVHTFTDNNLNSGAGGCRFAGVIELTVKHNSSESHTVPLLLTYTTLAGGYVGPCSSPSIDEGNFSDVTTSHIFVDDAVGGSISRNTFNQASACSIVFTNGAANRASGVKIEGNSKAVVGTFRQAAPFLGGFATSYQRNIIKQTAATYSVGSLVAGSATVTPASMEFINLGARLWCINADGTSGETVVISAVTSTTFTATFASNKAANFAIYGAIPDDQYGGPQWVPTVAGTGPVGGSTMTVQTGTYSVSGTKCNINGQVTWTALTGGAAGQLAFTLPFPARVNSQMLVAQVIGPTSVGNTYMFLQTTAGSNVAALVFINNATGALTASVIGATGTIYVSGPYDI